MRTALTCVMVLALGLAATGCGDDTPATPAVTRGPFGSPAAPAASTAPAPTTSVLAGRRHVPGTLDRDPIDPVARLAPTAARTTTTTTETTAEPEPRHLDTELAAAMGSPAPCIDVATARTLHGRLSVNVSVTVTPAGNVTRATVTAGALPEPALACLEARALGVRLTAPVEGAPRSVSTTLAFDVTTTDDETTRVTPEWHQPGAVARPGVVLSAGGTEGRPTGAVSPDAVLPAVGATGRPDGTVSPDIVLPARGGEGTLWPSGAPPPPPT